MTRTATPVPKAVIPYATLLGKVIERHRDDARLTQEDIAAALGISQSAYSRLEKGQSAMTVTQLRVIAAKLGRTPEALLSEADRWAGKLRAQGVEITDEKVDTKAGLLIALGILAALWAASR